MWQIAAGEDLLRSYRRTIQTDGGPRFLCWVFLGEVHARGRYLVKTTCTGCHNGELQGYDGFTPDLDIAGSYTTEELTRLLTTGEGKVKKDLGLMSDVAKNHFSYLTASERAAVVAYIKARVDRPQ